MPSIDITTKKQNHFISTSNYSASQIFALILRSIQFKAESKYNFPEPRTQRPLAGKTIALMFSKRSTRTRVSMESAISYLGGTSMFLSSQDIQLNINETLTDTARVVSSMVDGIVARVHDHQDIETIAKESSVPVINGLSDKYHPLQVLADLMVIHEHFHHKNNNIPANIYSAHTQHPSETLNGLKVAWVGDVNNVLQSILVTFPKCGISVSVACPEGYICDQDVVDIALADAKETGASVLFMANPEDAIQDSDIVITDTWTSMGQEEEKNKRVFEFQGFQITKEMVAKSNPKPDWVFMHCLPRKPEEVDDEVFYSDRSIVFQEAENRKYTSMAIIEAFLLNDGAFLV